MNKVEKHKIGSYIEQVTGFPFESSKFNQKQNGIRLLRGINITRGKLRFDSDNEMYYENREFDFSKYHLAENDIVISMDGSLVGRNYALVNSKYLPMLLVQRVARLRANGVDLYQNYLYQIISSDFFTKYVDSVKTSSGIPHISSKQINDFEIPLFPFEEQKKIAEILSTCDLAIDKLSKVIKAKEKQKTGLMQNLLSGGIRFKEFAGEEYIEGNLSEFVYLVHGYQFRKEDFVKEGIPVIKIGNVIGYKLDLRELTYIDEGRLDEFKDVIINNGDLLMSLTGNIGRVVEVEGLKKPVVQNYRVGKFISKDEEQLSGKYLKHILSSELVTRQFLNMSNQSAQANFGKQDMDKIFVSFPANMQEQLKISEVITKSDNEINNLYEQLDKLKIQKKGLMQQLLTGKIRVKVN